MLNIKVVRPVGSDFAFCQEVLSFGLKKNRQHNDQKDKQRSTKHTYKTKDRVTGIPLNYFIFITLRVMIGDVGDVWK
jgi:hypothetical protein